jgi:hypothetical protein
MAHLYVEVTRMVRARGNEAWALRLLGDVLANQPDAKHEEGASALSAAADLARELSMRPLEGRCHLTSGYLELRRGSRDAARTHLGKAAEVFRALGMPTWLAKAESAMQ